MKVLGIYHSVDNDGICSGAIIKKWCEEKGHELILHGTNDRVNAPWDLIANSDLVIISDFSYAMKEMFAINNVSELVWCDHHKSAIDEYNELLKDPAFAKPIMGLRDVKQAGCELTWKWAFPKEEAPYAVTTLGCYDCWRWKEEDESSQKAILSFEFGMRADAPEVGDPKWEWLLDEDGDPELERIYLLKGRGILDYQENMMERINSTGSVIEWEGVVWWAVNCHQTDSSNYEKQVAMLKETVNIHAVLIFYRRLGGWKYSLRAVDRDTDVSLIAKKYKGGGHAGAASFLADNLLDVLQ